MCSVSAPLRPLVPSTDVTDTRGGGAAADDGGDAAAPQDREPGADTRTPSEPLRSQRRHCCSRSRALHCPHSPQDPEGPKRLHAGGTGPRAELEGRPQAPKALVSCGPPLGMCQGWPRSGLANLKVTVSEKPSSFESQSAGCAPSGSVPAVASACQMPVPAPSCSGSAPTSSCGVTGRRTRCHSGQQQTHRREEAVECKMPR